MPFSNLPRPVATAPDGGESAGIGCFGRNEDVSARFEEQRHI